MNNGLISRLFGFKWSIYFCINETACQYIMSSNYPYDMIGTLEVYFDMYELRQEWKLYLNYNMTDDFVEINKETLFQLSNWMKSVSKNIKTSKSFQIPHCVDCTGLKETSIPWQGLNFTITERLKYYEKHGKHPDEITTFPNIVTTRIFK